MFLREKALLWWRDLLFSEKQRIVKENFPNKTYHEISTSSSKIEYLYKLLQH